MSEYLPTSPVNGMPLGLKIVLPTGLYPKSQSSWPQLSREHAKILIKNTIDKRLGGV